MASHQVAKFGGHKHSSSGDIMILVYHVILQDHMIKGLSDFMGKLRYYPVKFSGLLW